MSEKANNSAFPTSPDVQGHWHLTGLTKREYFAALAMQGIVSDPTASGCFRDVASDSVQYADALLAALEKERK